MKPVRITVNIEYKNCFIKKLQRLGYTKDIYENCNKTNSFTCTIFGEITGEIYIIYRTITRGEWLRYKKISFDKATIF